VAAAAVTSRQQRFNAPNLRRGNAKVKKLQRYRAEGDEIV
jgi:hypothetical protein